MPKNRRRQYYIDRLFQRRFLILFLALVGLITVCNVLFYFGVLRPAVEASVFRIHIQLNNPADIITGNLRRFVPLMVTLIAVLVMGAYTIMRLRLERFLRWLTGKLTHVGGDSTALPGAQFQGLEPMLLWFVYALRERNRRARALASMVRSFVKQPDPATLDALRRELEDWHKQI